MYTTYFNLQTSFFEFSLQAHKKSLKNDLYYFFLLSRPIAIFFQNDETRHLAN